MRQRATACASALAAARRIAFTAPIADVRIYNRALDAGGIGRAAADRTRCAQIAADRARTKRRARKPTSCARTSSTNTRRTTFAKPAAATDGTAHEEQRPVLRRIPHRDGDAGEAQPRDTFILIRGAYDQPGEKVSARRAGRSAAAARRRRRTIGWASPKWLVDPANPLTARVTVNRFWQMYFGIGHGEDGGGFRLAGRMADRIPNCSTGWPPNSSAPAGT